MINNNIDTTEENQVVNTGVSAKIESGASALIELFKGLCANRIQIDFSSETAGKIKKILTRLGKGKVETGETGIKRKVVDDFTNEAKWVKVDFKELTALWSNPAYTLARKWPNSEAFLTEAYAVTEKYADTVVQNRSSRRAVMDPATERIYEPDVKHESHPVRLGTSLLKMGVSQADEEFVYDHLRQNCGALYWTTPGEAPLLISREEKTGHISQDIAFWSRWSDFAYPLLKKYREIIISYSERVMRERPTGEGTLPVESMDQYLIQCVPRVVLEAVALIFRYRTEKGEKMAKFDGFDLQLPVGLGSFAFNLKAWKHVIANDLIPSLSVANIPYIKQFSNTPHESLTWVDLSGLDASGSAGEHLAREGWEAPQLPPMWTRYLLGKDGETPIFESDPRMSLLRLAYFVATLVVEGAESRMILMCCGSGNDGKTVLMETLHLIMGEAACTIDGNGEALKADANKFQILNKSLVCIPELERPGDIPTHEWIKSLTGGDTKPLRALYRMPIEYKPEHLLIMCTSNNPCYARGRAAWSRILPLAFHINYSPRDMIAPKVLEAKLAAEKQEFLQWCFDTLAFYSTKAKEHDVHLVMANGLTLFTDDMWDNLMDGTPYWQLTGRTAQPEDHLQEVKLTGEIQKAVINATGNFRFFATDLEDQEEDDAPIFKLLFDLLLEQGDESDFVSRADLRAAIIDCAKETAVKNAGIHPDNLSYDKRYKTFLSWLEAYIDKWGGKGAQRRLGGSGTARGFTKLRLRSSTTDFL